MLCDFIQWFRHYPVRVFSCWSLTWTEHDAALEEEFYEAMFNCPTLHELTLTGCILNDVDTTNLDMKMRVIYFEYYSISPDLVDYFKTQHRSDLVSPKQVQRSTCRQVAWAKPNTTRHYNATF
ncbi:hypothetical protein AC1031_011227 [Aphanomyces cochlioides]|nr:hypothetical protein AC1031_011227 [Aphanomyces cochlioides]